MISRVPIIGRALENRPYLQKTLANTSWLFADKVIRMGVGLFVGVWIARYLGPDQYGLWNYAMAFSALFGVLATVGLDRIVVRELLKNPEQSHVILGSAFVLKLIGGCTAFLVTIVAISLIRSGETLTLWLAGLSAAGFIFQSFNVIDFFFQSQIQSKYSVLATNASFLLVTIIKIALLLGKAPLIAFAAAGLAEVAIASSFLIAVYHRNNQQIRSWRFNSAVAWDQLQDSWPLILSSFAIIVYMRIDQVMIGQMLADREVGIFSAAVRISEAWHFFPTAIVSSVFPVIIATRMSNKELYHHRLQKLLDIITFMGVVVALITTILSPYIIGILYGHQYAAAADVLAIHIWAGVFVCLGSAASTWFMAENLQRYAFYRSFAGALMNIFLNWQMIPKYGPNGAAVATVISFACGMVFFNALHPMTRPIFSFQIRSLLLYRLMFSVPGRV